MSKDRVILLITDDYALCSCGGGADFEEQYHKKGKSWKTPDRACGRKFTHIATEDGGENARCWRAVRRDLPYLGVGWFDQNGEFVQKVLPKDAFKYNYYNFYVE